MKKMLGAIVIALVCVGCDPDSNPAAFSGTDQYSERMKGNIEKYQLVEFEHKGHTYLRINGGMCHSESCRCKTSSIVQVGAPK